MQQLVPDEANGWKPVEKDGVYDRKTLYDYIDGAAEVYLAYGFRQVLTRRLAKPGEPDITVDLFDMGSSKDAYGVFTFEREGDSVQIGQDSEYAAGFLRFWKGKYFASVLADRETPASKQAVLAIGREIAARIKENGDRPAVVSLLPRAALLPNSVRYFHQKSGLDYHYFLADRNILSLDERTDVALAQYGFGKARSRLMLVLYADAVKASSALKSFRAAYMPDAGQSQVVRTEDGKWVAADRRGALVAIVFEAASKESAQKLLTAAISRVEVKKDER